MSKKTFEIQVVTDIVRNPELSNKAFVVWVRLTQLYYGVGCKSELQLMHKKLMEYTKISENRTFKEILDELFENGLILNNVEVLPRNSPITIVVNEDMIPKGESMLFTQLTEHVINKKVIEKIGHVGVRMMYYYKSRINQKSDVQFCYASEETIANEIGINRKTVIKYNKILEKVKFIKIEQQEISRDYYKNEKKEIYGYTRYNNHVYVRSDKIDDYVMKNVEKIVV